MATDTWRGGNSGAWSDGANWFTLAPPGGGDTAVLGGAVAYTATVDASVAVGAVILDGAGATLDIASTLSVAGAVTVAASADVALAGLLAAGTLDFTAGGTLIGAGGTLAGAMLLGQGFVLAGAGTIANQGSIGWDAAAPALIALGGGGFDNAGTLALAPGAQTLTNIFVTSVYLQHGQPIATSTVLTWAAGVVADVAVTAGWFDNTGTIQIDGGTLAIASATFDNGGGITLDGVASQTVRQVGTTDGIPVYGVVTTDIAGQIEIGSGVATYDNTGTIRASSIVFDRPMALSQLGALVGGQTFDAGLDLQGGTLAAGTVSVGGLVQNGTISGGTLELQAGATLDNVAIGPAETVIEPASGHVTVIDPPSTGAAVTLDSVINDLEFQTVGSFDGGIVLGPGASGDAVGVSAGGVTLGPNFTLAAQAPNSALTFAGSGAVTNQGAWTLDGASLEIGTTLAGGGAISLADGATLQVAALAAGAAPSVSFGAGTSHLVLPGTGALGAVLSGLAVGDSVDFASVSSTAAPGAPFGTGGAAPANGTLDVQGASGEQASVALAQSTGGLTFNVLPDGTGGSMVEVACFVAGTRIATAAGAVPVEQLRPGDLVRTLAGRLAPVRWVGCTRVDLARHPEPARAAPIRIRADAFAPGRPARDLLVSGEHCLLIDGALVPALRLCNGATIAREDGWASVAYWHIELDRHDIVLAEGLAAESYLDTGNRGRFAGEAGARALHPDFSEAPDAAALRIWARHGCAPLRLSAPEQRAALRTRAALLGWCMASDPGIAVLADGLPAPFSVLGGTLSARLPAGTARVRLRSRGFVPAEIEADSGDTRRLGLAVASVCLGGWKLPPDALAAGWHAAAGEAWRWTDGDATIALPRLGRPGLLTLLLPRLGRYWVAPAAAPAPARARRA